MHARVVVGMILVALAVAVGALIQAKPTSALTVVIPLPAGARPTAVAVHPTTGRLYVTQSGRDAVAVVDPLTSTVVATVPTGKTPNQLAIDPLSGRVFVSNFDGRSITVIDGSTNAVLATLPVGGLGMGINPTTHRLYAAAGRSLSVIDTVTSSVFTTVAAPRGANLWGVAVDAARDRVYLADLDSSRVLVLDGATNAVTASVTIDAPARFAIAVSAAAGRVYVASYLKSGARLSAIDTSTNAVVATAPLGSLPFALALHEPTGALYVSNLGDDTVTALRTATLGVISTTRAGRSPMGLAVVPGTGRLVLVSQADATLQMQP